MGHDGRVSSEDPTADVHRIVESAKSLGVEMDEAEALRWLSSMAAQGGGGGDVVFDAASGTFGHRIQMLDFSTEDLAYFRQIGEIVGIEDRPGHVETALALSGSAAQSRIQSHPGDCDYFERVNVIAPTREDACRVFADVLREKALATETGATYRLVDVRFGSYPADVVRGGETVPAGTSIGWSPDEIRAGRIEAASPAGEFVEIRWDEVAYDPGWCKLDWVVADPVRTRVANASNMLDVTWEAPDGTVTPLDGYLDPYYQEVYLEAESIPIFSKIVRNLSPDALDHYIDQLEGEVRKNIEKKNYGKAAKRMYNVFRLSGRYQEAVYLRELFDEPATALYQAAAMIRSLDEAAHPGSGIDEATLVAQADELIESVVAVLEGAVEEQLVERLLAVRESMKRGADAVARYEAVRAASQVVTELVNAYFQVRLYGIDEVRAYLEGLDDPSPPATSS